MRLTRPARLLSLVSMSAQGAGAGACQCRQRAGVAPPHLPPTVSWHVPHRAWCQNAPRPAAGPMLEWQLKEGNARLLAVSPSCVLDARWSRSALLNGGGCGRRVGWQARQCHCACSQALVCTTAPPTTRLFAPRHEEQPSGKPRGVRREGTLHMRNRVSKGESSSKGEQRVDRAGVGRSAAAAQRCAAAPAPPGTEAGAAVGAMAIVEQ